MYELVFVQNSANSSRVSFDFARVIVTSQLAWTDLSSLAWDVTVWCVCSNTTSRCVRRSVRWSRWRSPSWSWWRRTLSWWRNSKHSTSQSMSADTFTTSVVRYSSLIHISTLLFVGIFTTCKCGVIMFAAHMSVICMSVCLLCCNFWKP